jgi:hypothetical protein
METDTLRTSMLCLMKMMMMQQDLLHLFQASQGSSPRGSVMVIPFISFTLLHGSFLPFLWNRWVLISSNG